tara:strand:- start:174 stop:548 length:375 start_codon:yes stop_codon:yes gene_type:complete
MDHHFPQTSYDPRLYESPPQPTQSDELMDIPLRLANTVFAQASLLEILLIAGLVALGYYIHSKEKVAKDERRENQTKFENLIIRTQDETVKIAGDIASMKTQLINVERELESQKDFLFQTLRKA